MLAGHDFPIEARIGAYVPHGLPADRWARVRPVFEDWATRASRADATLPHNGLTTALSRHLLWCDANGIPLDPRRALDPVTIDRALRSRKQLTEGSRSSGRSILARVGQALGPEAHPMPLSRVRAADPYEDEEFGSLVRWVLSFPGDKAISGLWPALVLGAGVGFDVASMRHLRGTHVSRRGRFVVVHDPGDREHGVPFLPRWEDEGLRLAEAAGEDYIVHPAIRNRMVRGLVTSLGHLAGPPPPATPTFQVRRLRATWMVHQMRRGIPPVVLLKGLGVGTWGTFNRYAHHVSWPGDDIAFDMLRGDG